MLPKGEGNTKEKLKARFHWDELIIDGIIESVSIDFDLFAANGRHCAPRWAYRSRSRTRSTNCSSPAPGRISRATRPRRGLRTPARAVRVRGRPTAAPSLLPENPRLNSRRGWDSNPTAWRGIAAQIGASTSLSLQAGASIDFNSSLSAGAGIGISAGVQAGASVSLDASFGLDAQASANISGAVSADTSAGFAIAAAGGVGAAIETVAILQAQSAADSARRSFGSAAPATAPSAPGPAPPRQRSAPLRFPPSAHQQSQRRPEFQSHDHAAAGDAESIANAVDAERDAVAVVPGIGDRRSVASDRRSPHDIIRFGRTAEAAGRERGRSS